MMRQLKCCVLRYRLLTVIFSRNGDMNFNYYCGVSKMKRSTNRILSFIPAAVLALVIMAVLPRTAQATTFVVNNAATFNATINSIYEDLGPHTIDLRVSGLVFDGGIIIDGEDVTLKLNGFTLSLRNKEGDGLKVINSGSFTLAGAGTLNVTGDMGDGVSLTGSSRLTLADTGTLKAYGSNCGVYAKSSSLILTGAGKLNAEGVNRGIHAADSGAVVLSSSGVINAVGFSEAGVHATGAKTMVQVTNATGSGKGSSGAASHSGAKIEVKGNVTGYAYGTVVDTGGEVTIDGMILFSGKYISVDGSRKPLTDYTPATTKTGYLTYKGDDSAVWVRDQNYVKPAVIDGRPFTGADMTALSIHGEVTARRINVYKYEKLKTTLYQLNRGDDFVLHGLAGGGKALIIAHDGREGYIAIRNIRATFGTAIRATSLKKAVAYILQDNGKYKLAGYFDKGQELDVHGIEGKYFVNKQKDATYYLEPSHWVLAG